MSDSHREVPPPPLPLEALARPEQRPGASPDPQQPGPPQAAKPAQPTQTPQRQYHLQPQAPPSWQPTQPSPAQPAPTPAAPQPAWQAQQQAPQQQTWPPQQQAPQQQTWPPQQQAPQQQTWPPQQQAPQQAWPPQQQTQSARDQYIVRDLGTYEPRALEIEDDGEVFAPADGQVFAPVAGPEPSSRHGFAPEVYTPPSILSPQGHAGPPGHSGPAGNAGPPSGPASATPAGARPAAQPTAQPARSAPSPAPTVSARPEQDHRLTSWVGFGLLALIVGGLLFQMFSGGGEVAPEPGESIPWAAFQRPEGASDLLIPEKIVRVEGQDYYDEPMVRKLLRDQARSDASRRTLLDLRNAAELSSAEGFGNLEDDMRRWNREDRRRESQNRRSDSEWQRLEEKRRQRNSGWNG